MQKNWYTTFPKSRFAPPPPPLQNPGYATVIHQISAWPSVSTIFMDSLQQDLINKNIKDINKASIKISRSKIIPTSLLRLFTFDHWQEANFVTFILIRSSSADLAIKGRGPYMVKKLSKLFLMPLIWKKLRKFSFVYTPTWLSHFLYRKIPYQTNQEKFLEYSLYLSIYESVTR